MSNDLNSANAGGQAERAEPPQNRHLVWRLFAVLCIFVLAVVLLMHFIGRSKRAQASATPTIHVVAATARTGDLPIYLNGLGSVTAFYTVTVRTRVDGQLFLVPVREGQMVAAGDVVAEIDPRPFQVQLLQAQGQKERDEAFLANARVDLERYRILYAQNAVPQQQLTAQIATVHQYEATVKADQGAVDSAKLNIIYAHITAPIAGRIGLRLVDPGNIVHASDQNGVLIITQLQPISVIFSIAQDYIPQVMKKLQAGQRLPVEAWNRDFKTKIATGTLLTIDNQVDASTGTVRLRATFPNRDNSLFPNQFVNARLLIDMKRNTVVVPTAAVQRGPQTTYVFVIKPDNTVEMRNVVPGPAESDITSIDKGLIASEVVVTKGVDKLRQGMKVAVGQRQTAAAGNP
jgi:multidrug efflux system membrane fusion protein